MIQYCFYIFCIKVQHNCVLCFFFNIQYPFLKNDRLINVVIVNDKIHYRSISIFNLNNLTCILHNIYTLDRNFLNLKFENEKFKLTEEGGHWSIYIKCDAQNYWNKHLFCAIFTQIHPPKNVYYWNWHKRERTLLSIKRTWLSANGNHCETTVYWSITS